MNESVIFLPHPWRTAIPAEWTDYNGHLRDAFYTLLASNAVDDLMEQVGLDRDYRESTGGTLYTLELHVHFLQEVKGGDEALVVIKPLAVDAKRLQVRCEVGCTRLNHPAAVIEMLLMHVQQRPEPHAAPLPEQVSRRLQGWLAATDCPNDAFNSRAIRLKRPTDGA